MDTKQQQKEYIITCWQSGYTYRDIANDANYVFQTDYYDSERVRDIIRKYRRKQNKDEIENIKVPEIYRTPAITVKRKKIMVVVDIHYPYHREDFFDNVRKHANEISVLIIGGDAFNNDSLSKFAEISKKTFEEEIVGFYNFIKEKHLDSYDRMDIPKDVKFQGADGEVFIPFEEIRKYIRDACLSCYDPLSELADVSVGSTENDPGWNTVITRSVRGLELLESAVSQGIIEIKPYPEKLLPALRKAVFNKKKRVLERPDSAYLNIPAQEKEYFLSSGGAA
jgi:hypothetical protein